MPAPCWLRASTPSWSWPTASSSRCFHVRSMGCVRACAAKRGASGKLDLRPGQVRFGQARADPRKDLVARLVPQAVVAQPPPGLVLHRLGLALELDLLYPRAALGI